MALKIQRDGGGSSSDLGFIVMRSKSANRTRWTSCLRLFLAANIVCLACLAWFSRDSAYPILLVAPMHRWTDSRGEV